MAENDITSNPSSPFYDNPREDNIRLDDQGDLISKFLFEPNHRHYDGDDYFTFVNKNDILTHTTDEEAIVLRPHMENIVILNRHLDRKTVLIPSGQYEKVAEGKDTNGNDIIVAKEVMVAKEIDVERFAISIRNEKTFIRAITVTAAGRGGMLVKDSKTVRLEKEQTIEDKTETRPGFWAKVKKK
jgi:hypothetical protein